MAGQAKRTMRERYDIVVIGSGFGGAITAARLAQAGQKVAILERGRRWRKQDFPRTTGQVARSFWQAGKSQGLLEYRAFKKIDVIQGVGVGGGSLHYYNAHMRAPEAIFRRERWPERMSRKLMDPYYELVQGMLESRPLTPPAGRALPDRTAVFMAAARQAGYEPGLVDIAVYTGPERKSRFGDHVQSACVYCGNCMLGCHVQAKNSLDITYISAAERNHGVEVFPLHAAECIEPAGELGYKVSFRRTDPDDPSVSERGTVVGKRVIVAAGTLGSTELLLRCRDQYRTLPALGPALGKWFSGNGDLLVPGAADTRAGIDPGSGPGITATLVHTAGDNIITVQDLGLPDPFLWFLEGVLPPRKSRFLGLVRLALLYVLRSLGLHTGKSKVEDHIDALLAGGRTTRFLPYLGMGTDAADGEIRLCHGELDVKWSHRRSRKMFKVMEGLLAEISEAAGGRYVASPLWRWPLRKLLTAHPLGGCVMGDRAETSVVNHHGEVWGYPGLYVTDGATVPSALAANPSLTIGALAERAAFWILHGRELGPEDPDRPASLATPPAAPSGVLPLVPGSAPSAARTGRET